MISTTKLARKVNTEPKVLFRVLKDLGYISRKDNKWILNQIGKENGGEYKETEQGSKYITWPDNINIIKALQNHEEDLITASSIGKHFSVSPQKVNKIMTTLGWSEKQIDGWKLTRQGEDVGGYEFESVNGSSFIKWHNSILQNLGLNNWFNQDNQDDVYQIDNKDHEEAFSPKGDLDKKYPPKIWTQDNHKVRSRGERMIDDFLFMNGIVHAYEKTFHTSEGTIHPDFYIPAGAKHHSHQAYIEFWGMDTESYLKIKEKKLNLYEKLGWMDSLIQINPKHLEDLDAYLAKMLLKKAHLQVM